MTRSFAATEIGNSWIVSEPRITSRWACRSLASAASRRRIDIVSSSLAQTSSVIVRVPISGNGPVSASRLPAGELSLSPFDAHIKTSVHGMPRTPGVALDDDHIGRRGLGDADLDRVVGRVPCVLDI